MDFQNDPEAVERFQAWLDKNWKHGPCPVCHTNMWGALPRLGQVSNLDYGGNIVPVFFMQCITCGYLLPFNAIGAGVLPRERPDLESTTDDAPTEAKKE